MSLLRPAHLRPSRTLLALVPAMVVLATSVAVSRAQTGDGTRLPIDDFRDLLVDQQREQVFVSGGPAADSIVVMNYDGTIAASIPSVSGAAEMVAVDALVYAIEESGTRIYKIDASTLQKTGEIDLGVTAWGTMALAGGRLWFAHSCGSFGSQLASVDLSTEMVTTYPGPDFSCGIYAASPLIPDALFMAGWSSIERYDISVDPPVRVAQRQLPSTTSIQEIQVTRDGQSLLAVASSPYEITEFAADGLGSTGFVYPLPPYPTALAVGTNHVVGGVNGIYEPDVLVFPVGDTAAVEKVDFEGTAGPTLYPRGLAMTEDERVVFAVTGTKTYGGDAYFHSLYGPAIGVSTLTVSLSKVTLPFGSSAKVTAHLGAFGQTSNKVVSIFEQAVGGSPKLVRSEAVNNAGDLTVSVSPSKNTEYWAEWSGDPDWRPLESRTRTINVKVVTTGKLLKPDSRAGKYRIYEEGNDPLYKTKVRPNHAGKIVKIVLQVHYAGKWRFLGSLKATLGKKSFIIVEIVDPDPDYRFRIRSWFSHPEDHKKDGSPWAYFKMVD